jgi:hypothetical protein
MNRIVKLAVLMSVVSFLFVGTDGFCGTNGKYHIGVITGTMTLSKDEFLGAEALIKEYGSVQKKGMIRHVTYQGDLRFNNSAGIASVVALADDPSMKAIVIDRAIPGTAEAFRQIRAKRPDILLFAGEPDEDPLTIQSAADLVVSSDFVSRGYTIPWAAKQLGAKSFVHISFPRTMNPDAVALRAIMEQACADLGLKFYVETVPDSPSGTADSAIRQYILQKFPQWILKYGKDTAFFCADDTYVELTLTQLLKYGGFFLEGELPSPLIGYPGALNLNLDKEAGNFPVILKKIEAAVVAKGGAGRFGTWAFSYGYSLTAGLGQHAINVIEGKAKKDSMNDLLKALEKYTPGAKWSGSYYIDVGTGVHAKNQILIFMDTYVFGKGFLPTTQQKIPEKYYHIQAQK